MKLLKRAVFILFSAVMMCCFLFGCWSAVTNRNHADTSSGMETRTPAPTGTPAAVTPTPARTPPPTGTPEPTEPPVDMSSVTAIGDSVMLGAASTMRELMPDAVIDAEENRQVFYALDILKTLDANGQLGDTVVIALGTNWPFPLEVGQEVIDYLGPDRNIYWVAAYGEHLSWQEDSNEVIFELGEEYDNVHVIRWDEIAPQHPDWLREDGCHLVAAGWQGYAELIRDILMGRVDLYGEPTGDGPATEETDG